MKLNKLAMLLVAGSWLLPFSAQAEERLEIVGSSTVFPFASSVIAEFSKNHPSMEIPIIESTGSGGGAELFCAGLGLETPSITNASRQIKDKEVQLCTENGVTDVTEYQIGYDGIAVMFDVNAPSLSLTKERLFNALNATVIIDGNAVANPHQKWSDVDSALPDFAIRVMGPPTSSGTRDSFEEQVFEKIAKAAGVDLKIRDDGPYITAGENDNAIISKLSADSTLLGVAGFSFLDQNADRVQGASIDGVEPTFDTIANGDYKISRSLWFYVKNAHLGQVPGIAEYVAEFTNEDTWGEDGYLIDIGLIPLSEEDQAKVPPLGQANGKFTGS